MIILFLKCGKPINKEILERYKKIQVIDSRNLLCEEHLKYAIEQAKKEFVEKIVKEIIRESRDVQD